MIKQIEKCPKCGMNTEGNVKLSLTRLASQKGAAYLLNKLIIITFITPFITSIVLPILGTFIGFIISFCILLYIQNYSKKISQKIDKKLYDKTTYNFTCSTCGEKWERIVNTGTSNIPEEILIIEKREREKTCASIAKANGIIALVFATLVLIGTVYCIFNEYHYAVGTDYNFILGEYTLYETNWWWYLCIFIAIIATPIAILEISIWAKYHNEYKELKRMSLNTFLAKYFK